MVTKQYDFKKRAMAAAGWLLAFTLWSWLTVNGKLQVLDSQAVEFVRTLFHSSGLAVEFFKLVTRLGSTPVLLILLVILLTGLQWAKHRNGQMWAGGALLGAMVLSPSLKNIFNRPRPLDPLVAVAGYSYPSGHALESAVFYGCVMALLKEINIKPYYQKGMSLICAVIIILIGLSRLVLQVHFASDVVGGWLAALFWLEFSRLLVLSN